MTPDQTVAAHRPRIEGEREAEIFAAVTDLLVEGGYDKLTFDAVASAAKVSKATLYRRWAGKAPLVLDAVTHDRLGQPAGVDTHNLRTDLLALACGPGGLCDKSPALMGALVPALQRDPDLFEAFRLRVVEPRVGLAVAALERAVARGEVGPGADLRLLATALPAICIHETLLYDRPTTPQRVAEILDQVVLPACWATKASPPPT